MARSSPRRTASTTATAAGSGSRKVPAKKRKSSQLSKQEGGAKAKNKGDWRKYQKSCSVDGCTKYAQNGAGLCIKHGASKRKLCSKEGCKNQAQKGEVCKKHGAKVTRKECSKEGCTNQAQRRGVCWRHGGKLECSAPECTNYVVLRGVCMRHGANLKVKRCSSEGCKFIAKKKGGLCLGHWNKKQRNAEVAAEQTSVAVPALPPIEPPLTCAICRDPYDISEMARCAKGKGCSCTICHDCLVTGFSRPGMFVNGQWQYYDMARCPVCKREDAFSLDDNDAAIVSWEMEGMYCFEVASVGASYASTSHEQGDPEWLPI